MDLSEQQSWVIDLDGVIWLMDDPIPGAIEAVAKLLDAGVVVTFATNNSLLTNDQYFEKLSRIGIDSERVNIVTSSMAAASMLDAGDRAYVIGGAGLEVALRARGVEIVESSDVDVVVVGWDREINYSKLSRATRALRNGARFVATNSDPIYPTPRGPLPGAGSIVAAVATAGGFPPEWAGKPEAPMAKLLIEQVGAPTLMVGDRLETDGGFARQLGCDFALVMSGVTTSAPPLSNEIAHVADDIAALVKELID